MPHSSGGGSHRGGSHSSHSSSHSGSSRGGSSASFARTSRSNFTGARKYVKYKNKKTTYVYSNYDITHSSTGLLIFKFLYCLMMLALFSSIAYVFMDVPKYIDKEYDRTIIIEDQIGIIDDDTELMESFKEFQVKTGVTPALITVHNEDWNDFYTNLEKYAYDLYINHFTDEYHWLIVYSEPIGSTGDKIDWYWEGMQGDNTDAIINRGITDEFNSNLQKYFTDRKGYSIQAAVSTAFKDIYPKLMKLHVYDEVFYSMILCDIVTIFIMIIVIRLDPKFRYKGYRLCPENDISLDRKCEYCQGIYVLGTVTACPHCGAPIPLENEVS